MIAGWLRTAVHIRRTMCGLLLGYAMLVISNPALTQDQHIRQPGFYSFWDALESPQAMRFFAENLSEEEILGQVFLLGYPDTDVTPFLKHWIENRGLGGIKIFPRNVNSLEELADTIDTFQRIANNQSRQIPLFVATDQEGGWVNHIKHTTSQTSGNLSLGASGLPADSYLSGYYLGSELAALGINMNFAPTVDVYSHPAASVIGPRAFSSDPVQAGLLGVAFFRGLQSAGVIATAKHFPGHGAANADSHLVLPYVRVSMEKLWQRELIPYRFLIKEGVPAIMTGHVAFPQITGNNNPASLSPIFLQDLLRERLGFTGILITDDLEMRSVTEAAGSPSEAAVAALIAGNDLVLISHQPQWQRQAWDLARTRMRTDPDFYDRVHQSALRVLESKRIAFTGSPPAPLASAGRRLPGLIPAVGATDFFLSSAARAVTVVSDRSLPLDSNGEELLLIGQHRTFIEAGLKQFPLAHVATFPFSPFYHAKKEHLHHIPALARNYRIIIFELANYNSLQILQQLEQLAENIIVLSALTPVYLRETPWVKTAIAVYGTTDAAFETGFAVITGDLQGNGQWPLNFANRKTTALSPPQLTPTIIP